MRSIDRNFTKLFNQIDEDELMEKVFDDKKTCNTLEQSLSTA